MKKKNKKIRKKTRVKKKPKIKKRKRITLKSKRKTKKINRRSFKKKFKFPKRKRKIKSKRKKNSSKETFRKLIRLTDKFNFRLKFKFNLDQKLQGFFQNISNKINSFKQVIEEERDRKRQERLKKMKKENDEIIKRDKMIKQEELKAKQSEIKEEIKLVKERKNELKRFIKEEQAQVRKEQAEKQRLFFEKIKLEKKIEQFRKREALEIKNLEKFVLKQERENYTEVQERIEKIKLKYQAIRDQKIRERIEQLGIEVSDEDTRSDLLEKERQFNIAREKIENNLESFYRSMASCIFQLNRRWLPKKMSLLRVIDRRYETSEIFIKLDEEVDENWIMLVYLKNNDPTSNIIVEDKTNPTNSQSNEYKPNEIFQFSDALVDSLTSMIDREYKKKLN